VTAPGTPSATPAERAARLLRWYPRAWRARYGEEFTELLIADIAERPRSAVRTRDVARGGLVARLSGAGLAGLPLASTVGADPLGQVRASIGTLGAAFAVCLAVGAAMWSQLTIAWQWTSPLDAKSPAMRATLLMSAAMLTFLAIAALAVLPVMCAVARNLTRSGVSRRLFGPLLVLGVAVAVLAVGGHHFGNGWPGTGGHGENGSLFPVIPAGLQAFAWALSLWMSSIWAHPAWLGALPAPELAWMAVSPIALAAATAAAVTLVRRAELPPRLLGYETGLAWLACVIMGIFAGGCGYWLSIGGGPGLAHSGLIDIAGTAVVALALGVAFGAQAAAMRGLRLARG
jgi:hypothetical protein